MVFSSLWLLCPCGNYSRGWQKSLDHRYPGKAGYARVPAAIVTGDMALLEFFIDSGNSVSGRTELGGGTPPWIMGTLAVPIVQGHQLPQPQDLWSHWSLSLACQLAIRGAIWLVLLCCLAHSGTSRTHQLVSFSVSFQVRHFQDPLVGVLSCFLAFWALKGPPWLGFFSAFHHIRHLKGHTGGGPSLLLSTSGA